MLLYFALPTLKYRHIRAFSHMIARTQTLPLLYVCLLVYNQSGSFTSDSTIYVQPPSIRSNAVLYKQKLFLVKQVQDNVTQVVFYALSFVSCKCNGARHSNVQHKHSLTYNTKLALKDKIAEAILNIFRSKCCSDRQI